MTAYRCMVFGPKCRGRATSVDHIGAILADQHDEWAVARRYLSETSMAALNSCHTDSAQPVELTPGN